MIAVSFEATGEVAVVADDLDISLPLRGSRDRMSWRPSLPSPAELLEEAVDLPTAELHSVLIAAWLANQKLFNLMEISQDISGDRDALFSVFVRASEALAISDEKTVSLEQEDFVQFYIRASDGRQGAESKFFRKLMSVAGPPYLGIGVEPRMSLRIDGMAIGTLPTSDEIFRKTVFSSGDLAGTRLSSKD